MSNPLRPNYTILRRGNAFSFLINDDNMVIDDAVATKHQLGLGSGTDFWLVYDA